MLSHCSQELLNNHTDINTSIFISEESARCMLCQDALEFIQIGCCNVQVCTSVMQFGYRIIDDLISGLQAYMASRGISQLADLVGEKIKDFYPASELDRETMVFPKIDRNLCLHVCPTGAISSANRMKKIK